MNANVYVIEDYENKTAFRPRKNKPNSNPIISKAKMNANVFVTKDYENETAFRSQKNKPKTNPISSKAKMNLKSLAKKSGLSSLLSEHTRWGHIVKPYPFTT